VQRRITIADWIAILILAVTMVAWGSRLEERVNAQDRHVAATIDQIRKDLDYIRGRVDSALEATR
jgi:hypothetical protein